jgi:hypothetical protein
VAVKVADLVRAYANVPPPKNAPLADLEAQLEALRSPDYRSPFQFKPLSRKPPGVGPYESLGTYASVAEALKPPAINVPSPYQAHHTTGLVLPGPTPLSELLTERYGQSPGLIGAAKFLYDAGGTLNRTMEAWRPAIQGFSRFLQEAALGLQNAQTSIRRWLAEAERQTARRKAVAEELLLRAYQAVEQVGRNKPQKALEFMRQDFGWKAPSVEHVGAFWEALQADHDELVEGMLLAPNPTAWLASRVAFRMLQARRERDPRDPFCGKLLNPDQEQKLRGTGHKQDEALGLDPGIIVARKYDFRRQTIEEISATGRPISQERSALVLECLNLGLDDEDYRQILGKDDAWRAFKITANNEREKLQKRFQENYPKTPPSERYLHKRSH